MVLQCFPARTGEEDGGARCRFVVVARTVAADVVQWCPVAGEIGGGGCVEDGRRGEN